MSQTLSPSSARCYGLARVARVWSVSRASVYRSLKETPPNTIAHRPGPVGACSDSELADHIRQQIAASRLHGEGYRKLWARLRFAGVRASPRRVRRVMGENGLLAPHRVGRAESKPHDGTIVTNKVNEMWGTDMTQTITVAEGRAYYDKCTSGIFRNGRLSMQRATIVRPANAAPCRQVVTAGDPAPALPVFGFGRAEVRQREGLAFLLPPWAMWSGHPNRRCAQLHRPRRTSSLRDG